jgi:hypothetical protein
MITRLKEHDGTRTNTDNKRKQRKRWRVVDADALNAELIYQTNQVTLRQKQS